MRSILISIAAFVFTVAHAQDSIVFPVRNEKGEVVFSVSGTGNVQAKEKLDAKSIQAESLQTSSIVIGTTNVMDSLTSLSSGIDTLSQNIANVETASSALSKKIDENQISVLEKMKTEGEARLAAKVESDNAALAKEQAHQAALKALEDRLEEKISKQAHEAALKALGDTLEAKILKQTERINALISIITKFDVSSELERLSTAEQKAIPQNPKK